MPGGTWRVQDRRSRTLWLGAPCYDPARGSAPPSPAGTQPVPPGPHVSVHRHCRPWRRTGTDAIITSCLAQAVYGGPAVFTGPPGPSANRRQLQLEEGCGRGFRDALRSWVCGRPEEHSRVYPTVASPVETLLGPFSQQTQARVYLAVISNVTSYLGAWCRPPNLCHQPSPAASALPALRL